MLILAVPYFAAREATRNNDFHLSVKNMPGPNKSGGIPGNSLSSYAERHCDAPAAICNQTTKCNFSSLAGTVPNRIGLSFFRVRPTLGDFVLFPDVVLPLLNYQQANPCYMSAVSPSQCVPIRNTLTYLLVT